MGNLSSTRGGDVPELQTHCKFLQHRPLMLRRSILCSGDRYWPPCPDLDKCKALPPPSPSMVLEYIPSDTTLWDNGEIVVPERNKPRRKTNAKK